MDTCVHCGREIEWSEYHEIYLPADESEDWGCVEANADEYRFYCEPE
jgi:hypothetical protein